MNAKAKDRIATIVLYIISALVIALLVSLIAYILYSGRKSLNPSFLFGSPKFGEAGGGIGRQLFNSFYLLIVTLIITIPLGLGAGIYLAEYAKEGKLLNAIRLSIETMASLPSIVVGLFGLLVFVQLTKWGYTLLSGAFAIAILNLPSLTRVSENAIREASKKVKEASLGLGATQWQTIRRVILPSAIPQILTGIILAAGRIFGEAAALLYTAGMSAPRLRFNYISLVDKKSPFSLFRPSETLAVYIWKINSEGMVPDAAQIAAGAAAVLVIMVLIFNLLARMLGKWLYNSFTGSK
ncbi:phosphate ABC transporter permease PstA [Clostridium swellfunianum]|uniref:phosphate ABC transporter permease PstA n=1 Tax=Clostridium swellfunianum TaxID=1367462 RepID=UPI00202F5E0C|nr:phosphate ABC transporter permease PstA [Clostridium swellfunianum]MCM0647889.1 phosphate ABC transporter permease PstA [Clostridium swellfunianum]